MKRISLLIVTCNGANAFLSPIHHGPLRAPQLERVLISPSQQRRDVSVGLFGDLLKKFKKQSDGENDGDDEDNKVKSSDDPSADAADKVSADGSSFFVQSEDEAVAPAETEESSSPVRAVQEEEESPLTQAKKLKAQAARIRLEAEKRQVELTLEKIDKLNSKLEQVKAHKDDDKKNEKEQKELEEELLLLKSRLVIDEKGEVGVAKPAAAASTTADAETAKTTSTSSTITVAPELKPLSDEELQKITEQFDASPEFLKVLLTKIAGYGTDEQFNSTDIITQLYKDASQLQETLGSTPSIDDLSTEEGRAILERAYANSKSYSEMDGPELTPQQIQSKIEELQNLPGFFKNFVAGGKNDTEIAIDLLTEEWENEKEKEERRKNGWFGNDGKDKMGEDGERLDRGGGSFSRLFSEEEEEGGYRQSDVSMIMESTFPQSTRKEGEMPDIKVVNAFCGVLGENKAFVASGEPIPVAGGYIIRGSNQCKNGNELIDTLDKKVANDNRLKDKISFFLIKDPFPNPEETMLDPLNWPQVIFVAGPNVARDPRPILGTIVSAVGISTTWYASIYPFLTNTRLFDRAEEAMNLADAGMPVDLSWLSDKSIPLFFAFMALQAIHETAHIAVAKAKNFEVTVPTLVPSVISGITGAITSLKTSPKNKSDLLAFSAAGPLAGFLCSLLLEVYGLGLTATADLNSLQSYPGLPLALLRQSSLGGGLVDLVLGNGVLNVPASAEGANMLASTIIPLHPLAIAGYVSLLVNALALVPVGRTDGGRISMSLFGRSGTQGVTLISLATLFVLGLSGSDLMLFYFGYVLLSQFELEIPLRNEVDDVGVAGVLLATLAGFLMILTLAPM